MRTPSASARRSAPRRARYSLCSHSCGSSPGPATSPCQIAGIASRARRPRLAASTGTARQSSRRIPRSVSCSSTMPRARGVPLEERLPPRPRRPACGGGSGSRSPAPSPLLPSASNPPRWDSRASARTPSSTTACVAQLGGGDEAHAAGRTVRREIPRPRRRVEGSAAPAARRAHFESTEAKATGAGRPELVGRYQKSGANFM